MSRARFFRHIIINWQWWRENMGTEKMGVALPDSAAVWFQRVKWPGDRELNESEQKNWDTRVFWRVLTHSSELVALQEPRKYRTRVVLSTISGDFAFNWGFRKASPLLENVKGYFWRNSQKTSKWHFFSTVSVTTKRVLDFFSMTLVFIKARPTLYLDILSCTHFADK